MTKQEKIQEAYGELYNEVIPDENGWIDFDKIPENLDLIGFEAIKYSESENNFTTTLLRPKSLQGIENNNGWIKIESENDLPKEDCHCWIMDKEKGLQCGKWKQAPNELLHKQACFYWMKKTTHYQPITKPQSPIY